MTTQQLIKGALQFAVCNLAHSCYPHLCQQLVGEMMITFSGKAQTVDTTYLMTANETGSAVCDS